MANYITQDGIKLTAESLIDLFEQLQELQPDLQSLIPDLCLDKNQVSPEQLILNLDHAIAHLIQIDYLRVIDVIDG